MKNKLPYFFLLLIIARTGYSQLIPSKPNEVDQNGKKQGDWIYLFDEEWNLTDNLDLAEAYQLISYIDGKPVGSVSEYSRNGHLLVEYDSLVSEDPFLYEGMQKVYSEEGNLVSIGYFHSGKMDTILVIQKFMQLLSTYFREKPNHLDLAYTANNLAYLYLAQNRYDSAEVYYKIAQQIRETELGVDHVIYANSCNKLGYVLVQQKKFKDAEPLYKVSLKVHEKVLGKESDYYVGARGNLAYIYMNTERYSLAIPLYQEAVDTYRNDENKN